MTSRATRLLARVRRQSLSIGLRGPSLAPAGAPAGAGDALAAWLDSGYHGEMAYMARVGRQRSNPTAWASWARTTALFADAYEGGGGESARPGHGIVSRYARGDDYHTVLSKKIGSLCDIITAAGSRALPFVDTSPLMERALAARGGLGWIGKNANLIAAGQGSYFFLGGLVTDVEWEATPAVSDGCGDCTACLDACPTRAIVSPRVVDARRCISYLTIELKGAIPRDLRSGIGNRIFGCDICQEVCPWNDEVSVLSERAYGSRPGMDSPSLNDLALMSEQTFFDRFRGTAVRRARWRGLLRNVMVALGNWGDPRALEGLQAGLAHPDPLVREHAAWGLGQLDHDEARSILRQRLSTDTDPAVLEEIHLALARAADAGTAGPLSPASAGGAGQRRDQTENE
ncbi:MAG: tRNA epoxyqueuosine(34) reductase QueG [Acidobacteriota bacterium]